MAYKTSDIRELALRKLKDCRTLVDLGDGSISVDAGELGQVLPVPTVPATGKVCLMIDTADGRSPFFTPSTVCKFLENTRSPALRFWMVVSQDERADCLLEYWVLTQQDLLRMLDKDCEPNGSRIRTHFFAEKGELPVRWGLATSAGKITADNEIGGVQLGHAYWRLSSADVATLNGK